MRKLKSKPQIQINGAKKEHRDASLFIIACEGEKTEAQYMGFGFLRNSRVKLHIIPSSGGLSAPEYIFSNLKEYAETLSLESGDRLWLLFDADRWPYETQIKQVQNKKVKGHIVNLAVSNPCFELFLYLHYSGMPKAEIVSSAAMISMLREIRGGEYSKTNLQEGDYRSNVNIAIDRAKETRHGSNGIPINPGTDAGKLINIILQTEPKRERNE